MSTFERMSLYLYISTSHIPVHFTWGQLWRCLFLFLFWWGFWVSCPLSVQNFCITVPEPGRDIGYFSQSDIPAFWEGHCLEGFLFQLAAPGMGSLPYKLYKLVGARTNVTLLFLVCYVCCWLWPMTNGWLHKDNPTISVSLA